MNKQTWQRSFLLCVLHISCCCNCSCGVRDKTGALGGDVSRSEPLFPEGLLTGQNQKPSIQCTHSLQYNKYVRNVF